MVAIALSASALSAQTLEVTLTATDHHGYHISCFGGRNGAIDATVSGGTAPYTYYWSNGASTEDLQDLASGLYILRVADAANAEATTEITLTEPVALKGISFCTTCWADRSRVGTTFEVHWKLFRYRNSPGVPIGCGSLMA